ncbi:MAG: ATP-binding protein [Spirochaetia bacterium]
MSGWNELSTSIAASFVLAQEGTANAVLITNHPANEQLDISSYINADPEDYILFSHTCVPQKIYHAYYPFLDILGKGLKERKHKTLKKLGIYPGFQDVFTRYFFPGTQTLEIEKDPPVFEEREWNKQKMLESICNAVIHLYPDKTLVFQIQSFEKVPASTVEFITYVLSMQSKGRIMFLLTQSENSETKTSLITPEFGKNRRIIRKRLIIIDMPPKAIKENEDAEECIPSISIAGNAIDFFAALEAYNAAKSIYSRYINRNSYFTVEELSQLFFILGKASMYLEKFDEAVLYFRKILEISSAESEDILLLETYRYLSYLEFLLERAEQANRYASLGVKKTEGLKDNIHLHYLQQVNYVDINCNLLKLSDTPDLLEKQHLDQLIKKLTDHNMQGWLAYLLSIPKVILGLYRTEICNVDEILAYTEQAWQISAKMKNKYRKARLSITKGLVYQQIGDKNLTLSFYKKGERFFLKSGDFFEAGKTCNTIGYFYYTQDEFRRASGYYARALKHLEGITKFEELCSTIYNFATLFFHIGRFSDAIEYYEILLTIMDQLSILELPFNPRVNIYSLLGSAYLKTGEQGQAIGCKHAISRLGLSDTITTESYYLKYFTALSEIQKGNFNDAELLFEKVFHQFDKEKLNDDNFIAVVSFEYALFLAEKECPEAAKAFAEGKRTTREFQELGWFSSALMKNIENGRFAYPKVTGIKQPHINLKTIIEFTKQRKSLSGMHDLISEINLLNGLQEILTNRHSSKPRNKPEEIKIEQKTTFLFLLFQALYRWDDEQLKSAEDTFFICQTFIENHQDFLYEYYPFFLFEFAKFYLHSGKTDTAYELMNQAFDLSTAGNFPKLSHILERFYSQGKLYTNYSESFIDTREAEIILDNFHKEISKISLPPIHDVREYTNTLVSIVQLIYDKAMLLDRSFKLLYGSFSYDMIVLVKKQDFEWINLYSIMPAHQEHQYYEKAILEILSCIDENTGENQRIDAGDTKDLAQQYNIAQLLCFSVASKADTPVWAIFGAWEGSAAALDKDYNILSIAMNQILSVYEKIDDELLLLHNTINLEYKVYQRTDQLNKSMETIQEQSEEIRKYNEELEALVEDRTAKLVQSEKLAALGSLVAGLAHEINTPLGLIVTSNSFQADEVSRLMELFNAKSLKRSYLEGFLCNIRDSSNMVRENVNRIRKLVGTFKMLSIDHTGQRAKRFSIAEYIHFALLTLQSKMKNRNILIDITCNRNWIIYTFPSLFSQVLSNILLNSIEHAFPKSKDSKITVTVKIEGNKYRIICTDNGKGMSEETVNRIFDPFYTTNRGKGSTGLGMHIVSNIVNQNLQGSIACESIKGTGTTITLILPQAISETD